MRGLLFTEFLTFAEKAFGPLAVEDAIEQADLPSGGSYAATGSYPYQELFDLLDHLPLDKAGGLEEAMQSFGSWLSGRFKSQYKQFFEKHSCAISFLYSIDDHIHVEVRKLYPDAVPPRVTLEKLGEGHYLLHYNSHRPFAPVALGLTIGSLEAFGGRWRVRNVSFAADHKECELSLIKQE